MKTTSLSNTTITPVNFRPLRRLCGLGIAAIGLSALIASAQATTIPVTNGNFETEFGNNSDPTLN